MGIDHPSISRFLGEMKQAQKLQDHSYEQCIAGHPAPKKRKKYEVAVKTSWLECKCKIVSGSCVFGIGDLENMLTRPELIAHKFYFTWSQPPISASTMQFDLEHTTTKAKHASKALFMSSYRKTDVSTTLFAEMLQAEQQQEYWEQKVVSLGKTVDLIPGFRQAVPNCHNSVSGETFQVQGCQALKVWQNYNALLNAQMFRCAALKEKLTFFDRPLSKEEKEYPLAYGMLVYDNAMQIYLLLSAIYQPQNAYCIAVDAKSSDQFKADMDLLADCFPNIFVMQISQVEWYTYSVVRGVWNCLKYLSQLDHPWKYYQYLSGVDLPLKTNLEMVRIFKQLNGTVNTDIRSIPLDRIQRVVNKSSPLKLYKSSLSALLSRESIDGMTQSQKVRDLLIFAQQLDCPDEALWATILGNPEEEQQRLPRRCGYQEKANWIRNVTVEEPFALRSFYISRYQVWVFTPNTRCHGKYTHFSCVYGILDLSELIARPELVAHKFYLSVEPACYFCIYHLVRQRALDGERQRLFKARYIPSCLTCK
uniref:MULE transposase domain-containing protein n=1 Tax=Ditylenchus dipsaci TaxID=166011 RepID=A0A915CXE2_9BILA